MNISALNNICCGLFVLTACDEAKQNGCIINTVMQVSSQPIKIAVTVNKNNYTTDIILKTRKFNVSCIDESADFSLFVNFGFSSGRETDKFAHRYLEKQAMDLRMSKLQIAKQVIKTYEN